MKYVSTRDLRNRPGFVREVALDDDLVLTANGKPFAILVAVEEGEFEETAQGLDLVGRGVGCCAESEGDAA